MLIFVILLKAQSSKRKSFLHIRKVSLWTESLFLPQNLNCQVVKELKKKIKTSITFSFLIDEICIGKI